MWDRDTLTERSTRAGSAQPPTSSQISCSVSQDPPSQCSQLLPMPLAQAGFHIHPPGLGNFLRHKQDPAGGTILHGHPQGPDPARSRCNTLLCLQQLGTKPRSSPNGMGSFSSTHPQGACPAPAKGKTSPHKVGVSWCFQEKRGNGAGRTIGFKIFGADESACCLGSRSDTSMGSCWKLGEG